MCDVSGAVDFGRCGSVGSTGTAGAEEEGVGLSLVDKKDLVSINQRLRIAGCVFGSRLWQSENR